MIKTIETYSIHDYLSSVGFNKINEIPRKELDDLYKETNDEEEALYQLWKLLDIQEGEAYYIEIEHPILNTKKYPYKVSKNPNKGQRTFIKAYLLIDPSSNTIIEEVTGLQKDVESKIREIYEKGYTGDIMCRVVHIVKEGVNIVMKAKYSPSTNIKKGSYIVLGTL